MNKEEYIIAKKWRDYNRKLVSYHKFSDAKKIIIQYEKQQLIDEKKIKKYDVNLFDVLNTRAKNKLHKFNEDRDSNNKIINASDVAKLIKLNGSVSMFQFWGFGMKTSQHLLEFILPLL